LSYHTCRHDERSRTIPIILTIAVPLETRIRLFPHAYRIFNSCPSCNSIRAPRVYNHSSNTLALSPIQQLPRHCNWSRLELIRREHRSGGAWLFGCDDGEIVEAGI
jgi:hypothetical protein